MKQILFCIAFGLCATQIASAAELCDRCALFQQIQVAANKVQSDINVVENALLQTGDPNVRVAFAPLNGIDSKAAEISVVAQVALDKQGRLDSLSGADDIMAVAFIVMLEAAASAQEDLKSIMDGVKNINGQKDSIRKIQDIINRSPAVASDMNALIGDTVDLLSLFGLKCDLCGD